MPRTQDIEVYAPTLGLDYATPGTQLDLRASPNLQNIRFQQGIVKPAPGYDNFGTLNTVLGTPMLFAEYKENDGDNHLLCFTTKYIYEFNTTLANWGNVVSRQKVLSECENAWTASANITATQETSIKVNGNSVKLAVGAAFTTGLAAYEDFVAVDTTTCSHIHFWIRCSRATSSGDLQIVVDNTSACASPLQAYDVPALTADTWTQVEVAIGSGSNAAVISVGLNIAVDLGAYNVYIDRVIMADRFTGDEDDRWSVDTYLDNFYATNGLDPIQKKDHSLAFDDWAEAVAATYKCKRLRAFRNHLCMGYMIEGGVDFPQRFRWTDSGAVTFGGTAGSTETEGADAILQLRPLGNRLAIYKDDSIVVVTHIGGSTVYRFDRPVTNTGILAPDLVTDYGELHAFASSDNVYFYGGGSDPVPFADKIRDELFRNLTDTAIGRAFMHYSPENEELYIFMPTDSATDANVVWVYHTDLQVWTKRTKSGLSGVGTFSTQSAITFGDAVGTFGAQTAAFGDRAISSTAPIILLGTTSRTILQIDDTLLDDLSAAIDKIFDTADFTATTLPVEDDEKVRYVDNTKRWVRFAFEAKGTAAGVYFSRDEGSTFSLLRTVTLTDTYRRYFVSCDIPAAKIRFRLRNNTAGGAFYLRWHSVSVIGRSEV